MFIYFGFSANDIGEQIICSKYKILVYILTRGICLNPLKQW